MAMALVKNWEVESAYLYSNSVSVSVSLSLPHGPMAPHDFDRPLLPSVSCLRLKREGRSREKAVVLREHSKPTLSICRRVESLKETVVDLYPINYGPLFCRNGTKREYWH